MIDLANILARLQRLIRPSTQRQQGFEQMREKSPERYTELAAKLITAIETPAGQGLKDAQSLEEIAERLLLSVGAAAAAITPEMVEAAKEANALFVSTLERIAGTTNARAQHSTHH
jgi:hypothetical protein